MTKEPIKINSPFYSAGKKYNWPGNTVGIGLAWSLLSGDPTDIIEIVVGSNPKVWAIEKQKARDLVIRYKSKFIARNTTLAIIPWSEFKSKDSIVLEQKQKQNTLFK
jgi:hypothetical protein